MGVETFVEFKTLRLIAQNERVEICGNNMHN